MNELKKIDSFIIKKTLIKDLNYNKELFLYLNLLKEYLNINKIDEIDEILDLLTKLVSNDLENEKYIFSNENEILSKEIFCFFNNNLNFNLNIYYKFLNLILLFNENFENFQISYFQNFLFFYKIFLQFNNNLNYYKLLIQYFEIFYINFNDIFFDNIINVIIQNQIEEYQSIEELEII